MPSLAQVAGRLPALQAAVANRAAQHLVVHLGEEEPETVRQWAETGHDLASLLPADFQVPTGGIGKSLVVESLRQAGPSFYDEVLNQARGIVYAAIQPYVVARAQRAGIDPRRVLSDGPGYNRMVQSLIAGELGPEAQEQALAAVRIDKSLSILASAGCREWYNAQMESLRLRVIAQLEGSA